MDLLKQLDMRQTGTATRAFRWGLFLCQFCKAEVERTIDNGKLAKSCGCARSECKTTHGLTRVGKRHPLFIVWSHMKDRCNNPKNASYHRYGGRGITVCGQWASDFAAFHKWATENGWQEGLEIDRENNDGGYEPGNCRFVTGAVNTQNSSKAKLSLSEVVQIKAEFPESGMSYESFAKRYGVTGATISSIVRGKSWVNVSGPTSAHEHRHGNEGHFITSNAKDIT